MRHHIPIPFAGTPPRYRGEHSERTELFCSYFQVIKNPIEYFKLFQSSKKYRVDASHIYFSNPETPPTLKDLFPDARFLIILRKPNARAQSLYQHMRRVLHADGRPIELIETFHDALLAEEERFHSPKFFTDCRHYFYNFMYLRSSHFDEQLSRYFSLYPRDRFLVISLAELQLQPQRTITRIGNFLDLDPADFGHEMPIANVAPTYSPPDPASEALMAAHFGDLTARVDRLIGQKLDWSL